MDAISGNTKGEQTRGTAAAADALGVSRQHLRYVLLGRRHSPGLLARFEEWKKSSAAAPVIMARKLDVPDLQAAICNFNEEFLKTVVWPGKNTVILVVFQFGQDSPVLKHPNIGKELESELLKDQYAYLDAELFPENERWDFYWVKRTDLAQAMTRLKTAVASRGLLSVTRLFEIEDHQTLQEWWPGNAGALRVLNESE